MNKIRSIFLCLFLIGLSLAFGQPGGREYGKNRVQYNKRTWKYLTTENFRIFYYPGGNGLAHNAGRILEDNFDKLLEKTGYYPRAKVDVIVYNSISDKQQSNIGLQTGVEFGGQTELIKSKIEVAFDGDQMLFQNELVYEASILFIRLMAYGDSFREAIQNSHLINLPEWFTVGAARYIAYGRTAEMYDYTFQTITYRKKKDPTKFEGEEAYVLGQSLWAYIAEKYGEQNIPNILNLARIFRSEEEGVVNSLGISLDQLIVDWKAYYQTIYDFHLKEVELLDKKERVIKNNRKGVHYSDLQWNDTGTKYAFSTTDKGFFRVYVVDKEKDTKRLVYFGGRRVVNQQIDLRQPKLAWKSDEEIGILTTKKSRPLLITKTLGKLRVERKKFVSFDKILDFDFSPNGKEIVFTAIKKGNTNVFFYNINRDKAYTITNDIFDERSPKYASNGGSIYFLSNKVKSKFKGIGTFDLLTNNYVLQKYDLRTRLITNEIEKGFPIIDFIIDNNKIFLQLDRGEQYLLYELKGTDLIEVSPTNASVLEATISGEKYVYVSRYRGKEFLFEDTLRLNTAGVISTVLPALLLPAIGNYEDEILDLDIAGIKFRSDVLHSETFDKENPKETLFAYKLSRPFDYENVLGVDMIQTSLALDQLRGGGIWLQSSTSEYFGDHQFNAGLMGLLDIRSSSYEGEYRLLKYRNDITISYRKDNIFLISDVDFAHRYHDNEFDLEVSHPFSSVFRAYSKVGYTTTRFSNLQQYTLGEQIRGYSKFGFGLVYDNTISFGKNLPQGLQFRLNYTKYGGVRSNNEQVSAQGFNKFEFELKNYQRVFKQLVFASKISFGAFGGKSPKRFLIGGVDNWLFSRTNKVGDDNPLVFDDDQKDHSDVLFVDYVTSVRGFDYNRFYGSKHLVTNMELRVPLTKLLYSGPVSSPFIRNFQVIGFFDGGTAWENKHPFQEDNDLNKRTVVSSGFTANVTNYRNPFIYSYGTGVRSELMGYYMKLDIAWGVQNFVQNRARLHLSLGYDF